MLICRCLLPGASRWNHSRRDWRTDSHDLVSTGSVPDDLSQLSTVHSHSHHVRARSHGLDPGGGPHHFWVRYFWSSV